MKTLALSSIVISLSAATLFGQTQSEIDFLRARADAHERKISQLEKELSLLKAFHAEKQSTAAASKETKAAATAQAPKAVPVAENSTAMSSYVVKPGDMLSRIASRHKTSVAAIAKENKLSSDRIYVGQKLRIPGAVAPAAAPVQAPPAPAPIAKHKVKSGETFFSIAREHKVSVSSLMASNPGVEPTRMYVGQTLLIDGKAKVASSSANVAKSAAQPKQNQTASKASPAKTSNKTKEVASKAPAVKESAPTPKSSAEPKIRTITVHEQVTFGQFASKHGASTTQLNALNGLSLSKNIMLAKGSELYVPQY